MKIALLNLSDSKGGAAMVTARLCDALARRGHDVSLLVCDNTGNSPFASTAAPGWRRKIPFLAERLKLFARLRFDRSRLFQLDPATDGLPLWRHPNVKGADAVFLNWTNQGMLSLNGLRKILSLGKPVIVTMHDMWAFTGICHHAGTCRRFEGQCGDCPLLPRPAVGDLSHRVWKKKNTIYSKYGSRLAFVAVSSWLEEKAAASGLLKEFGANGRLSVIHNAFQMETFNLERENREGSEDSEIISNTPFPIPDSRFPIPDSQKGEIRILFGAARIDDPVKDHRLLVEATQILAARNPELSRRLHIVAFGSLKDPYALEGLAVRHTHMGTIPPQILPQIYRSARMVVSTSIYETLPGTLVEGQAYGAVPVALDQGGQRDIVDHLHTGYLAAWNDSREVRAARIADGIEWAATLNPDRLAEVRSDMATSVRKKFSPNAVASAYEEKVKSLQAAE